ncbi:hypothetical protein BDB00DRAFT_934559 [Zychaea mexicana]|uniref:uncharacterized protein n=1 Tax=Zychaea mexicana TaxID=64656 RepID=UPI0022FEF97C|nr:uncharacterized protein BDB00DRAFT_934559 [Zychaea mexicana]KAI9467940.1 hypothetical protein BDB00DRAFT_934559 [Zychaea mexicana]
MDGGTPISEHHSINIDQRQRRSTVASHAVEEQLLSLSPSSPKSTSWHHDSDSEKVRSQSEALQQTFDDLDRESRHSHDYNASIVQESSIISRTPSPISNVQCPIVTPNLYVPLPTTIRHYLHEPKPDILAFLPYPLRTRQPVSKRLQRIPNIFISGSLVTQDDHHQRLSMLPPLRKRHSLASGQIDRLVHAHRDAMVAATAKFQNESDLWWPAPMHTTPEPETTADGYFDYKPSSPNSSSDKISSSEMPPPVISPPRHPFEA